MINYIDDMRYYGRIAAKEYMGIESQEGQKRLVGATPGDTIWLDTLAGTTIGAGLRHVLDDTNVYDYYKFTKDETYLKRFINAQEKQPKVLEFLLAPDKI